LRQRRRARRPWSSVSLRATRSARLATSTEKRQPIIVGSTTFPTTHTVVTHGDG
jgi:hypothetical protein